MERNECCPKCGSSLLARIWKIIYCLNSSCDFAVQSKRESDKDIKSIQELQQEWQ